MGWNERIKKDLGGCGKNVKIGESVIFTNPKGVFLGDNVRIDPFTLITTGLETGNQIHICAGVVIIGGSSHKVRMGDWTFIGYHSELFCASEDYSGKGGPINTWGKNLTTHGDIEFDEYSGVASSVTVFPGVKFPRGAVVGVRSLVYKTEDLMCWHVHKGVPAKPYKPRDKTNILIKGRDPEYLVV
jgi:acetyltransferase-like isoleucine patch superfamily enzyme